MPGAEGLQSLTPVCPGRWGTPTSGPSAGLCGIKTVASLLQGRPSAGGGAGTARLRAASLAWPIFPPGGALHGLAPRGGTPRPRPQRVIPLGEFASRLVLGAQELQRGLLEARGAPLFLLWARQTFSLWGQPPECV